MDAEEIRIIGYRWTQQSTLTLAGSRALTIEPTGVQNTRGYDDMPEREKKANRLYKVKEEGVAGIRILSELELEREIGGQEATDGR